MFFYLNPLKKMERNTNPFIEFVRSVRLSNPNEYGIPKTKKGERGYIPNGWVKAVKASSAQYRQTHPAAYRKPATKIDWSKRPEGARQATAVYRANVRALQRQYYPQMGRKLSKASQRVGVPRIRVPRPKMIMVDAGTQYDYENDGFNYV